MANLLKLYADTQNNALVQSDSDVSGGCTPWETAVYCPLGSRLLKAKPWPIDRFIFDTEGEAKDAAEALAQYLGTKVTNVTE